ncbi:MAG: hypothetical protein IJ125_05330, partial [Atopobiaceae bacterium]|nr:hypothetical protein [Atopobiaceae bacterium]
APKLKRKPSAQACVTNADVGAISDNMSAIATTAILTPMMSLTAAERAGFACLLCCRALTGLLFLFAGI